VYGVSDDNTLRKIAVSDGTEAWQFSFDNDVYGVSVGPNGDYVYGGSSDYTLRKFYTY